MILIYYHITKNISKFIYILRFLISSIKYSDILAALESDVSSTTIGIYPVNSKSSYIPGDIIIFNYNSGQCSFIDPKSIYLSYKSCVVTPDVANGAIVGTPVYSPFMLVDTINYKLSNNRTQLISEIKFVRQGSV